MALRSQHAARRTVGSHLEALRGVEGPHPYCHRLRQAWYLWCFLPFRALLARGVF